MIHPRHVRIRPRFLQDADRLEQPKRERVMTLGHWLLFISVALIGIAAWMLILVWRAVP